MNDRMRFLADLNALGKAMRVEVDAPTRELYWREVGELLTDDEWTAAVRRCIQQERTLTVAGMLKLHNEQHELALRIEAVKAYEHVGRLARYGQAGAYWTSSDVAPLGEEATKAFDACGGCNAFQSRGDGGETFVRRAFVDAYIAAAHKRDSVLALPPKPDGDDA